MRILITGATGSLGQKIITSLQHFDHQLKVLVRTSSDDKVFNPKVELVTGDLLNENSLLTATKNIELVIHMAAISHTNNWRLYYQVNTEGTKKLIHACEANRAQKFIFISSRTASKDGGAYAHSKLLAEQELQKSRLDWVILRPSEIYGGGENEAIAKLIRTIQHNQIVPVVGGEFLLSPVFIEDIIETIITIIQKGIYNRKIYTLAGPEELTYSELVDRLSTFLGVKKLKIYVPIKFIKFLAFVFYLLKKNTLVRDQILRFLVPKSADITLAEEDLNFRPRSLEEGLREVDTNSAH